MFQRSHRSGGSWFSRLRGNKAKRKSLSHRAGYRIAKCELLEERKLLTTTLYVDFGAGFSNGRLRMTVDELLNNISGPDLNFPPTILPNDTLQFESMKSYMARNLVDFDGKGAKGDASDYTALRNSVMDVVRRQYEPFDVVVKEAKATSLLDVTHAFNTNNGDPSGEFDAYVFVSNIVHLPTSQSIADLIGLLGIASAIDLDAGANQTDETVIVTVDSCIKAAGPSATTADVVIGGTVSHEAGHSFSLRHAEDGYDGPFLIDNDLNLLSSSEIMREGGGGSDPTLSHLAFFTRFSLQEGDRPSPLWDPFTRHNYYNELVTDLDIGPNPNGLAYVTGTGAFDDIFITRIDDTTAFVSVTPHRSAAYSPTSQITFAPFTYNIDYTNGILIDTGWSHDRVTIDATLGVDVRVRGGPGRNELRVISNGVPDAFYRPSTSPDPIPGLPGTLGGTVILSGLGFNTNIDVTEFGTDSAVVLDGFVNLLYMPPEQGGRVELTLNGGAIDGRVRGPNGFIETTIMRFVNTANVIIDTSQVLPIENVDTNDRVTIAGTLFAVPGLQNFEFRSGRGDDKLTIAVADFVLPVPGGEFKFDGGDGIDTIATDANAHWTLNDDVLAMVGGSSIKLLNMFGEVAEIAGGGGANTIRIETWAGTGFVNGNGGTDNIIFGLIGDIDTFHGSMTVMGGAGDDTITLDDSGSFDTVNYSVGKTRVTDDSSTPTPFGRVAYDGSVENLILTGTLGQNIFYVTPGKNLNIKIAGLDPPDGTPPLDGDQLSMFFGNAGGRRLINSSTSTGAGAWTFTTGEKPVFFEGIEHQGSLVAAAAAAGDGKPLVKVFNSLTNKLMFRFYAYEQSFKGGVNVVMADVTGDGILDVIVAPGAGRRGEVKVYDSAIALALAALHPQKLVETPDIAKVGPSIIPEGTSYTSGLHIAAGDVDGDGDVDVITSRQTGLGKVRVYEKTNANNYLNTETFTPYSSSEGVTRGAVVAAGDVDGDGRDEIITAPGVGASVRIKVFEGESGIRTRKFFGFESSFRGGVSIAAGDSNGDGLDEIFVAAGGGGGSRVRAFSQYGAMKSEFKAYTTGNVNAPVQIAARASSPDDMVALYLAQGNDGETKRIRVVNPLTGATVDSFLETDPEFGGGIKMG
jgi:hypothetical protein